MNWKFWTWDWKFWLWENPKPEPEPIEEACEYCPEPQQPKPVAKPFVIPDPSLEFPVVKAGPRETIVENLSEIFESVKQPVPPPPIQENPALMDAVVEIFDRTAPKTKRKKKAKVDPLVDIADKALTKLYADLSVVEAPKKAAKKTAKKVAKKAPKKTVKKVTAKKK